MSLNDVRVMKVGLQGLRGPAGPDGADGPAGPAGSTRAIALSIAAGHPLGWPEMPAAATEIFGDTSNRAHADLTDATEARIFAVVITPAEAGALCWLEYSLLGSIWVTTGVLIPIDVAGVILGAYIALPLGARAPVYERLMCSGGDGDATRWFGRIQVDAR